MEEAKDTISDQMTNQAKLIIKASLVACRFIIRGLFRRGGRQNLNYIHFKYYFISESTFNLIINFLKLYITQKIERENYFFYLI